MAKHLFIIGAQRCGTTYLYKILDSHPEVCMAKPVKPEPKYFMNPGTAGKGYETYLRTYFSNAGKAAWLGEKSTSYIECDEAAIAIKRIIPDATLLVILRNPVERAISHYAFSCEHRLESYDIERAIRDEPFRKDNWRVEAKTSVNPFAYTERGKYAQYLERWEGLFGKDRLILLVAEQFIGNQSAVAALYRRLGIDSQHVPESLAERVNAGSVESARNALSDDLRSFLREMFRPWNHKLEKRYGLDLSCWDEKA